MYIGREAVKHYIDGDKGHLIIKKNDLHFVKKVSFSLRFLRTFGFGDAAKWKVAEFANANRELLFQDKETVDSFNVKLKSYNKKCFVWWKKTKPIQALNIQEIAKSLKISNKSVKKEASVHSFKAAKEPEQTEVKEPANVPLPEENENEVRAPEPARPLQVKTFEDELKETLNKRRKGVQNTPIKNQEPSQQPSNQQSEVTPPVDKPKITIIKGVVPPPPPPLKKASSAGSGSRIPPVKKAAPQEEESLEGTLKEGFSQVDYINVTPKTPKNESTISASTLGFEQNFDE